MWVAPSSITAKEQNYFDSHFEPYFRIETMIFSVPDGVTNMIRRDYLQKIMTIKKQIERATVEFNGETLSLSDFCYKFVNHCDLKLVFLNLLSNFLSIEWGDLYLGRLCLSLSLYLSIYLFIYLFYLCVSVCLSLYLSLLSLRVCLSVCLSVGFSVFRFVASLFRKANQW